MPESGRDLMNLPVELRLQILRALFRSHTVHLHNNPHTHIGSCKEEHPAKDRRQQQHTNLFLVSRRIKQEADPIFWKESRFELHSCVVDVDTVLGYQKLMLIQNLVYHIDGDNSAAIEPLALLTKRLGSTGPSKGIDMASSMSFRGIFDSNDAHSILAVAKGHVSLLDFSVKHNPYLPDILIPPWAYRIAQVTVLGSYNVEVQVVGNSKLESLKSMIKSVYGNQHEVRIVRLGSCRGSKSLFSRESNIPALKLAAELYQITQYQCFGLRL